MKKQVILFKTHYIDKNILKEFKRLRKACNILEYDIFLLYDNSKNDFELKEIPSFLFTFDDFKKSDYILVSESQLPKGKNIQWFHTDFPLLFFYSKNKQYNYYWMIEFDLRFNGDWKYFFEYFIDNDSDFIANSLSNKKECSEWWMWDKHNLDYEDEYMKNSVFPIVRVSKRSLSIIDEKYKKGIFGYCELIYPTILNKMDYRIDTFNKIFSNKFTFQFRNSIPEWLYIILKIIPKTKNKLFHPVRQITFIRLLKSLLDINFAIGKIGILMRLKIPKLFKILKPYFPDRD